MKDLDELWLWAIAEVRAAKMLPPDHLHSQSGERDDWGHVQDEAIRGLPFTKSFGNYLDGGLNKHMTQALASLKPLKADPYSSYQSKQSQKAMYRIVSAVVTDGQTDTEVVRRKLGMAEFTFQVAALNGLRALRTALERNQ